MIPAISCRRLLQAKADREARRTRKARERGQVDAEQADAEQQRKDEQCDRDQLFGKQPLRRSDLGVAAEQPVDRTQDDAHRQIEQHRDDDRRKQPVERQAVRADVDADGLQRVDRADDAFGQPVHPAHPAIAAKPRSRSAIRSAGSSSPIDRRTSGRDRSPVAVRMVRVSRHDEACITAPAEPEPKWMSASIKRVRAARRAPFRVSRKARWSGKVARPDRMARIAGQRGMENAADLGPCREPIGDRKTALAVARIPDNRGCRGRAVISAHRRAKPPARADRSLPQPRADGHGPR